MIETTGKPPRSQSERGSVFHRVGQRKGNVEQKERGRERERGRRRRGRKG